MSGEGLDNPLYGTVSNRHAEEDNISCNSEEFQTSFSQFQERDDASDYTPNVVVINHYVDTGESESAGTSPSPHGHYEGVQFRVSMPEFDENTYESV